MVPHASGVPRSHTREAWRETAPRQPPGRGFGREGQRRGWEIGIRSRALTHPDLTICLITSVKSAAMPPSVIMRERLVGPRRRELPCWPHITGARCLALRFQRPVHAPNRGAERLPLPFGRLLGIRFASMTMGAEMTRSRISMVSGPLRIDPDNSFRRICLASADRIDCCNTWQNNILLEGCNSCTGLMLSTVV